MSPPKESQPVDKILVSLDALLDTRLGAIAQKYPDLVTKFLSNRQYFERIQDKFPGVPHDEFVQLYKKRNVDTLKHSMMTNMPLLLNTFIKSAAHDVLSGGVNTAMVFDINIHPYRLDEDEKQDLIGALEFHIGDAAEISIVSIPNEFLIPAICKAQYVVMIMYDFGDWMKMHAEAFREVRMPNLIIYAPELLEKLPNAEENKLLIEAKMSPFEASRIAASPAFTIRFLSIDMYSIRDPKQDVRRLQMKVDNSISKDEPSELTETEEASVFMSKNPFDE